MASNKRVIRSLLATMAVVVLAASLCAVADAATPKRLVKLTAGQADTVDLGRAVADVLVANPSVADVGTLRSDRLYIVGRAIGDTNVLAFDDQGNPLADITVQVRIDEGGLKQALRELFPKEKVEVRTIRQEVVLSGEVSSPAVANQVRDLAARFLSAENQTVVDMMKVRGDQQVMLKVKMIEANRNTLREYGITTSYTQTFGPQSAASLGVVATPGLGQTAAPFGRSLFRHAQSGNHYGPLSVQLQALEREGLVNTLAEPTLTAISGETAGFLAGGEFPVPVGRDRDGNITLEFKQFGVSLNFTPTVLSEDNISLQLSTEVSAKSEENTITLIDTIIPGLTVRRADTTVQMSSGGTIMIAGLIKSDTIDNLNSMPGLSDIPILGDLFKSKSFTRNETELLILVTPYVVEPFAAPDAVAENAPSGAQLIVPGGRAVPSPTGLSAPLPPLEPVPVRTSAAIPAPSVESASLPQASSAKKATAARSFAHDDRMAGTDHASQAVARTASKQVSAPVKARSNVLSETFVQNMQAVYGRHVPVADGRASGYIVE